VDNASAAARIVAVPGYAKPGEDWIARAESLPVPAFRHAVRARIEEMAQGVDHVVPVTAHVSERTRDDFHRAGVIASREAGVRLTPGQTFTLVVRSYLESHDDSRPVGPSASRSERTRDCETSGPEAPLPIAGTLRSGPGGGGRETADPPDGAVTDVATAPVAPGAARRVRAIPADVRREVLSRSADRCEVPGCPHDTFLEYAHILAHASGGGRDAPNLLRLCHAHHVQFDAGYLVFCGWRPDEDHARPTFSDARGDPIGTVRRAGAPDVAGAVERTSPDVPAPTANPCAYAPEPACPARPADVPESDRPSAGILDVAIAAEELASIGEDVGGPIMEEPRGEPGDDWCVAECTPTWGLPDFADPPNPP
jgi:hypothetical protein